MNPAAAAAILEPLPSSLPRTTNLTSRPSPASASRPTRADLAPVLTRRELGRALLARQMLLTRGQVTIPAAVERLVGLQAQNPLSPYVALWSRIEGFQPDALGRLVASRRLVRSTQMRATIHLTTARDCLTLGPLMQSVVERTFGSSSHARDLVGVDRRQLRALGRELLEEEPRTGAELGRLLARRWPRRDRQSLSIAVRCLLPVVQVAPRGVWGQSLQATWATVERYLGMTPGPAAAPEVVVRRYLGAFGPASVADLAVWCGLAGLRAVVEGIRGELRTFRDEQGAELFDLPRAPRPPADTPSPPRFLPDFDNVLLSHADRGRIVEPRYRRQIFMAPGPAGSFLVDGMVAGIWRIDRPGRAGAPALMKLRPFGRLMARDRDELEQEGQRLLAWFVTDAPRSAVQFVR